jgi:hypothetical protein
MKGAIFLHSMHQEQRQHSLAAVPLHAQVSKMQSQAHRLNISGLFRWDQHLQAALAVGQPRQEHHALLAQDGQTPCNCFTPRRPDGYAVLCVDHLKNNSIALLCCDATGGM